MIPDQRTKILPSQKLSQEPKQQQKKKNQRERERPTLKNLKSRADKIHRGKSLDFESHKFDGIGKHLDISTDLP